MAGGCSLAVLLKDLVDIPAMDVTVSAIALDSRQVKVGSMFVALSGTQMRGHDYIDAAIASGAAVVLYEPLSQYCPPQSSVPCIAVEGLAHKVGVIAERFYGEPTQAMCVVGITGTNGKTSCSHFLAQALHDESRPCAVIGTLGNGLWGALGPASHTTPDAVSLHGLMRRFADAGAAVVAMEVSSHGLDQGRVAGVDFDIAVLTNLSRDHLDYHADMAAYAEAKSRLFRSPALRYAVLNGDDEFGRRLIRELPATVAPLVYRMNPSVPIDRANVQFIDGQLLACDRHGLHLRVVSPWGEGEFVSSMLGRFNASNLLAVLAVLLVRGIPFEMALEKLSQLRTVAGRMEHFCVDGQPMVVVDYAHTPDALSQVLSALRDHCEGRLWVVFGCGGERDAGKRPLMGEIATRLADQVVLTDDNPRHEDPDQIISDIAAGITTADVKVIRNRADAIAFAIAGAAANDVVLVAGKGHETYQQIAAEKQPFSDRRQVQQLLGEVA